MRLQGKSQKGNIYIYNIYPVKYSSSKYIKNSYKSLRKRQLTLFLLNGVKP